MKDYLNKLKSCCDLLGAAGCRVLEQDQILYILAGLGHEYDSVMVTITSRGDMWTVQDVTALLLSFESRLDSGKQSTVGADGVLPTANFAQVSGQRRDNNYQSNRGGFSGKSEGGRGHFGGRSSRGGRGGRGFSSKIICQLCQKPGHGADRCWHRFEQSFTPQPIQQGRQQQQSNPSANMVQTRVHQPLPLPSIRPRSEYNFEGNQLTSWYPDSGATNHISNDLSNLNISSEYHGGKQLILGNGSSVDIDHVGESSICPVSSQCSKPLFLKNLLHVPAITKNLLSVSQFARDNGVFFEFHSTHCLVKDQDSQQTILKGSLDQGLYRFFLPKSAVISTPPNPAVLPPTACSATLASSSSIDVSSVGLWHRRLGHPSFSIVTHVLNGCNIPFDSMKTSPLCHPCNVSKAHRLPYSDSKSTYSHPLELVHSDLWGPSPTTSRCGYSYYVTFIDQFSRHTWIYLLKLKSDVYAAFKNFKAVAENLLSTKIKVLQSDWGGEFQGLSGFLKDSGIHHRLSC